MKKIFVKIQNRIQVIDLDTVLFFTCEKSETYAVLNNKKIKVNASLDHISKNVGIKFYRTHKSFLVNIDQIDSITKATERTFNINFLKSEQTAYLTYRNYKILCSKYIIM